MYSKKYLNHLFGKYRTQFRVGDLVEPVRTTVNQWSTYKNN